MFYIPEARHFILGESHVTSRSFLRIISLPWLSRVISPKAGICQEIFRNGTYILSVGPNFKGPRPKVRKGDYIYYISLAPRAYSFSGAMVTKDGAQRSYDMHIELKVVSSTRFIEMYDNKQDPARQIFMQFKQTFEYYVSKMGDAAKGTIDPWLDRQVAMLSQEYGIQVIHPTWFFHTDDNKSNPTEQEDIEQAAQQRKREIEMEYDLKAYEEHIKLDMEEGLERRKRDFMREKTGRQNDFAREEKMKQHILDEQKKLLSSIVDSAIRANNDRMNESLDYNNPTYLVLQDSLKLLTVLNNASVSSQDQKEIIDAMRSTGALPVDPEEG